MKLTWERERGGGDKGNLMIVLKLQNLTSVEHELFWDHSLCDLISIFFSFQFERTVYHCLAENQLMLLYNFITMKQQTMSTQSRHRSGKIFFSNLRRFGWLGSSWLSLKSAEIIFSKKIPYLWDGHHLWNKTLVMLSSYVVAGWKCADTGVR